jgi:uncharacterized membrane protein SpoIIM required for sporulation
MDVDAFVVQHQLGWLRLDQLTKIARHPKKLTPPELDELLNLYQSTSSHLAFARGTYRSEQALLSRLTMSVAAANGVLHGQANVAGRNLIVGFLTRSFPAAVWHIRRFVVVAALLTILPWAALQIWVAKSPAAFSGVGDKAVTAAYVDNRFEDYYRSQPAEDFASQVFFNNILVGVLAFVTGIFLCVMTVIVLVYNGANVGIAGGLFTHVGRWQQFWGLILPHGLLELSAVIVAGAAGLRIGWTVIDPGDRRRMAAIAAEGRRTGVILTGLVGAFGVAAMIEGFVTGSGWPTPVRLGIGIAAFAAFWGSILILGPRAERVELNLAPKTSI